MKLYQISEPSSEANTITVGIDLGTTNSLIGFYDGERVKIIPDKHDVNGIIPSVITYNNGEFIVGYEAVQDEKAAKSVKRLIGRGLKDITTNSYDVAYDQSSDEIIRLQVGEKCISPVEISAEILKYLKKNAEDYTGKKVTQAVITVPAHFDDAARTATKDAAKIAGIQVLRILNEPTAAAIAYGLDTKHNETILVYDLGGGTFDVSILKRNHGIMVVVATGGDNQLGGDDFNVEILKMMYRKANQSANNITPSEIQLASDIKEYLSENPLWNGTFLGKAITLTKTDIIKECQALISKTIQITRDVLFAARLRPNEISQVILAGGATRMPAIQKEVTKLFTRKPLNHINPDQVVVIGAVLQAQALTHGGSVLVDVVPLSLGIELLGGIIEKIIARNTPIPAIVKKYYTTYKDNQTGFKIHIVQGEGQTIDSCRSLGRIELTGLPLKPAGEVKLEVVFRVDVDGLLVVSATELDTSKSCEIEVKPSYGLSQEELEKLLQSQ